MVLRDGLEPSFPDYQPEVLTDCTNGAYCRTILGGQPIAIGFLKGNKLKVVRRQGIEPCAC